MSAGTPNKYYAAGEARAARVQDLFASIAPRYDLLNDVQSFGLHRLWKRRLVQLAIGRAKPPAEPSAHTQRALDVCCGTGDLALALAQTGMEVDGLDFSEPMLTVARNRLAVADNTLRVTFSQGDAQALPYPDGSFDVVTVGYGLRNLADWKLGLQEMWRVAKPGGRLLVLDFAKPDNRLWRALYFTYLRCLVPVFGKVFCGDSQAYAYILESLHHYPAQHGVAEQMKKMGCEDVRMLMLLGGVMSINYGKKEGE